MTTSEQDETIYQTTRSQVASFAYGEQRGYEQAGHMGQMIMAGTLGFTEHQVDEYVAEARETLDELSETYTVIGLDRLIFAMMALRLNHYVGLGNEKPRMGPGRKQEEA